MSALTNPTLSIYALTTLLLVANLLFLWGYSGVARGKTKIAINAEDASAFGTALDEIDPPPVRRVLRAHANAQATIYPFLALGLVFVLLGGGAGFAKIDFGIFVVARFAHSLVYLAGKQPWRTLAFTLSGVALVALLVEDGLLLGRGAGPP